MKLSVFGILFLSKLAYCFQWATFSSYDHFTKRLAPGLFAGGWLTTRQIEYLAAAGFKSIISTVNITTGADTYNGVDGTYPSSDEEVDLAKELGMEASYFTTTFSSESVELISNAIHKASKPVYIHCHVSCLTFDIFADGILGWLGCISIW